MRCKRLSLSLLVTIISSDLGRMFGKELALATQTELDFADNARPDPLVRSKFIARKHGLYVREEMAAKAITVRLSNHLMKEVFERVNSADRAMRWKANFDSNGGPRGSRANVGPAAKIELKEDEGIRKAGWYKQIWKGEHQFIGEAGARAGLHSVLLKGAEKKANRANGGKWSLGQRSVIQKDPLEEYGHTKKPPTYCDITLMFYSMHIDTGKKKIRCLGNGMTVSDSEYSDCE